jgi:predicted aminopeptidase
MNLFENFVEKKNFSKWLEERKMTDAEKEKESESHKKVDMESFIKQYGAIKGKSVYYKTMKRRAMGKGKKSIKKK